MKYLKKIIGTVIALALVLSLCPGAAAEAGLPLTEEEWQVLLLTNRERLKEGLEPVTATEKLQAACDIRAEEIARKFSHERPDGSLCFTVMEEAGLTSYRTMGENIAAGQESPEEAVDDWMHSPGHRANILMPEYVHMGTGYCSTEQPNEDGISYHDHWVQFFYTGFTCGYDSMELEVPENITVPVGTSVDDMGITAVLNCRDCGKAYLPVMSEFCTGYEAGKEGAFEVTVRALGQEASFTVIAGNPVRPGERYRDVHAEDWCYDEVEYAAENDLMGGVGNDCFDPEGSMTRAMLVTVLWRLEGSPEAGSCEFEDVPGSRWYAQAVSWAAEAGVAGGVGDGKFDPEGNLTREQMAAVLCRYAGLRGTDTSARAELSAFPDRNQVSSWAEDALRWCVAGKIIGGSDGKLLPGGSATRAQVAAVLMRYIENIIQ